MYRTMMSGKIHRATVTEANLTMWEALQSIRIFWMRRNDGK